MFSHPDHQCVPNLQNHSCDPNCAIVAAYINESNIEKPLLAIFTIREVEPFQELCFSYYGRHDEGDEEPEEEVWSCIYNKDFQILISDFL